LQEQRRPIRSFVLRQGRVTNAQRRACEELLTVYGVPFGPAPLDLDRLAHFSNLQREIDARRLLNLQLDIVLRDRAETRQFHLDLVFARLQDREVIDTGLITNRTANKVRCRIRHRDGDTGNDSARRVMNDSADARLRLGNCRQNAQDNQTQDGPETPTPHISSVHVGFFEFCGKSNKASARWE